MILLKIVVALFISMMIMDVYLTYRNLKSLQCMNGLTSDIIRYLERNNLVLLVFGGTFRPRFAIVPNNFDREGMNLKISGLPPRLIHPLIEAALNSRGKHPPSIEESERSIIRKDQRMLG